jgi:ferric-dicitrate binding protein FerR (iron transport regulator)
MRNHRTGVWVISALLLVGLHIWSVDAWAKKAVVGSLAVASGEVLVNKVVGIPGTTVFEGNVIATGSKSSAIIDLRSGTRVTVGERSEVSVPYGMAPTGLELRDGTVDVQTGSGQVSQINTKLPTSVVLESVDGFPALCRIASNGSAVSVLNEKGRVEIHGAGAPILVPPGKSVLLQAGKPQAGSSTAGKMVAAIPSEVVERQGAAAVPLHVMDPVYWQDLVRTEMDGRARFELTGGTILTIGARSQMRIIKHDADTEQTEVELTAGRLRGQIVKLTKPGASFQMKTQTAVIGVVGTDVIVVSTADSTTVYCVDGSVNVCSNNPSVSGCSSQPGQSTGSCCVTLLPGQSTTVPLNGAPTAPAAFSPETLQSEINQFLIGTAGRTGAAGFWPILETVAGGATIALLGVTISDLGSAKTSGNQASSSLSGAAGSLSGAPGAYGNLPADWNAVGCALNNLSASEGGVNSLYVPPSGSCP